MCPDTLGVIWEKMMANNDDYQIHRKVVIIGFGSAIDFWVAEVGK